MGRWLFLSLTGGQVVPARVVRGVCPCLVGGHCVRARR
ncbi:hypothetical protein TPSea814_000042a [Treponema pallidum subsp. pallidum str. Sea 81-4]|nr:hypothetical protein TPChic_0042a [Treponema pallidum subsp. pallidum str. Chicago]AHN66744.1 hypothetical protein TPSea814_000042a [Treponema pallidum subsp. pallidum str. Sea 81-4]